ncbi:MAG: helix-hairpin-helix domain-containing protein [Halobacteriaceae archaeon]
MSREADAGADDAAVGDGDGAPPVALDRDRELGRDLTDVPGIGPATAESLSQLEDPASALANGDVARIARAPDVSPGRAVRLVRAAARARHDDPGEFLATDRARSVYQTLRAALQDRAVTTYAARRLATHYPSGVDDRIEELRAVTERALDREPDPAVRAALTGVEPVESPGDVTVRDRCVATTDAETYARAREALPELSVELVEDARDLADLARGYATVVALDDAFAGLEIEGDVRVEPDALDRPAELVPERVLAFFAANRDRIRAAATVVRRAGLPAPVDLDELDAALAALDADGAVTDDAELDRLRAAVADLDAAVAAAESVADDRLREAIRERDVTIEGTDLLSLVERGAGVDSLLASELATEYEDAVAAARDHLVDALDLDDDEAAHAERIFGDEPTYPVEADGDAVQSLRDALTAARDRRAARRKRDLAATLSGLRDGAARLVRTALELDVELAIARFAADWDCTLAERRGRGFDVAGGRSPLLDLPADEIEPVDYAVEDVALLSGVNSGGKTSTLDLVAAATVLAHAGLPVPADRARVPAVEELRYHATTGGTVDAGAFEGTLRTFGELAADDRRRLVLVDELESITEPGASAKLVAGILEELVAGDATAVVVSHLAGEIDAAADVDVRVDGIRALGLADGDLVVDRSPEPDHHARSTPELIVEKLADDADGPEGTFYGRLLAKFQD